MIGMRHEKTNDLSFQNEHDGSVAHKTNKKTLLIALSTLALAACNGGGGGSSGGDTPSPTPTPPAPVVVQALSVTQNVVPSLNKVGSHQVWYMVVNNPNDFTVNVSHSTDSIRSEQTNFRFDPANTTMPINPSKFAMQYDGGVSGVTTDCLSLFNQSSSNALGAHQSCAFKLEAQWAGNTSGKTNFNFKMAYQLQYDNSLYIESIGCVANSNTTCLSGNQNLQYNILNMSKIANDLKGNVADGNNENLNMLSIDGTTYWDVNTNSSGVASVYSLNYNASTNTYNKVLTNTYNGSQFTTGSGGFAVISTNGQNFYQKYYNQDGVMTSVQSTNNDLGWAYGLDGNIYGGGSNTGSTNLYKLNQANNTIASLVDGTNQAIRGASANGNLLTTSRTGAQTTSCYNASNSYSKSTMNMSGLTSSYQIPKVQPNGYFVMASNTTDYYNLYNQQQTVSASYLMDIDNCVLSKTTYMANFGDALSYDSLTTQFGIARGENANLNRYIESATNFSNGLNGGN